MRLLLDTNVFLEVVFKQPQVAAARAVLDHAHHDLFISDFSLRSVGVVMFRRGRADRWPKFLNRVIFSGHVKELVLPDHKLADLTDIARRFALDFDDSYQYVLAEHHNLTLVSLDHDFDRTPRGRLHPQAVP